MKQVYTTGEAAHICGLSLSTLKRWIKRGVLRVYRTPGGDIRIPHEHLCDFMRAYDIPFQHTEAEAPRILIAVGNETARRNLLRELSRQYPQAQVETAETAMDLGFILASFRPWIVVLEQQGGVEATAALCRRLRRCLAPETLRVGLVGASGWQGNEADRPDVLWEGETAASGIGFFVEDLVGVLAGGTQRAPLKRSA